MITFDGVSREVCTVRRIRTNTPLQALATLNDSAYIDMARRFAQLMKTESGNDVKQQIKYGYERATYHEANEKSVAALLNLYNSAIAQFKNDPDRTCRMLGEMGTNTNANGAAMVVVANAMLNLDEVLTKN
jgi:hypothetical protein